MSKATRRRKSKQDTKPIKPVPQGPKLTFQWSVSASKLSFTDDSCSSFNLPPIETGASPFSSSSWIGQHSPRYSLVSARETISLPDLSKRRQSQVSVSTSISNKQSNSLPLLLNYNELHRAPSPLPVTTRKDTSPSLSTLSVPRSHSTTKRKVSFASNSSSPSHFPREQNHHLAPPRQSQSLTRQALKKNDQFYSNLDAQTFTFHVPMIKVS